MLTNAALIGFALAVTPLIVTPGASFTLVSARGLVGDRSGAWATIVGTAAGIVTHAVLAGAGLAAVMMRSAELFRIVRIVGALYLVGLGVSLLWHARRSGSPGALEKIDGAAVGTFVHGRRAYLANVLNVKAAAVYLTLAPQFIPTHAIGIGPMLILAIIHIVVMVAWLGVWSIGLTSLAARFEVRRWRRRIDAIGGAVLVWLGVRAAAEIR